MIVTLVRYCPRGEILKRRESEDMSFNLHALYMFSTFAFMVMLPFQSKEQALMGAAAITVVAMLVPGSTAWTQSVEAAVLGD